MNALFTFAFGCIGISIILVGAGTLMRFNRHYQMILKLEKRIEFLEKKVSQKESTAFYNKEMSGNDN